MSDNRLLRDATVEELERELLARKERFSWITVIINPRAIIPNTVTITNAIANSAQVERDFKIVSRNYRAEMPSSVYEFLMNDERYNHWFLESEEELERALAKQQII